MYRSKWKNMWEKLEELLNEFGEIAVAKGIITQKDLDFLYKVKTLLWEIKV